MKASGLCFLCLQAGHRAKECDAKCALCGGRHHALCCFQAQRRVASDSVIDDGHAVSKPQSHPADAGAAASLSCNSAQDNKRIVLPTARVKVLGDKGPVDTTVLFDSGSDRTYVSQSLVRRAGAKWAGSKRVSYVAFGGGKSSDCARDVFSLSVHSGDQSCPVVNIEAVQVPVICSPLQRPQVNQEVIDLLGLDESQMADSFGDNRQLTVDILIGLDVYWGLVKPGVIRRVDRLVAQLTVFGWVLSGAVDGHVESSSVGCQLLTLGDLHEDTVRNLWSLEGIGVRTDEEPTASKVLEDFNSSVHYCSAGRYEVGLPWKEGGPEQLVDNRSSAEGRLAGLSHKLARDPELADRYSAVLTEMEQSGIIEEIPSEELVSQHPTFYLPHRPVLKESSTSTKVRPVFDASAPGPNGVALNDCIETGPCLIPSLVEVLLRFMRWRYAVTADIVKAFLQLQLKREDRDVHRFLWECDGTVRVMRFVRVTFGVSSSPFLLNATIRHHLSKYDQSHAVVEMQNNFYVDDFISGADTEEEGAALLSEAQSVMAEAGMTLSKCTSNSPLVFDGTVSESSDAGGVKVLGVKWIPDDDVFTFDGVVIPDDVVPTKRVVLSFIARLFDPLGFLTPFSMVAKCLFQTLWQLGLQWDEVLPDESRLVFTRWLHGLESLKQFRVPRSFSSQGWSSSGSEVELHAFGDASPAGYGAAVYIWIPLPDDSFSVSLVMAKGRVAPVKRVSLPRLELLGSLLAARLVTYVRRALHLPDSTTCRCWTDSMITLGWIRGDPERWKRFVSNRVSEIHSLTCPSDWAFVPGEENPSDLTTRGVSAEQLMDSREWLRGPSWLSEPGGHPLPSDRSEPSEAQLPEVETVLTAGSEEVPGKESVFDVERWSSFSKAVRVVAWVRRFIRNARNAVGRARGVRLGTRQAAAKRRQLALDPEEVVQARRQLLICVQREAYPDEVKALQSGKEVSKGSPLYRPAPFVDDDGLLRVKSRLQHSDLSYDEVHPILLPSSRLSELLIREQHVLMRHAGVPTLVSSLRGSYWIIGLRRLAKGVKRQCVPCQRQDSRPCNASVAPLPKSRVTEAPPFAVTGVDFAGPVFCVDEPRSKYYICLFTCAVTRAIHLELVGSLSLDDFMLALRRFAARRGMPVEMHSDNAPTLKGADSLLQRYFGHLAPAWKYIAPLSPWWGGWWERLVRSVKSGVRKSLGKRCLRRVELETVLHEVESCVNSRPLVYAGDDLDSTNPLTPSHFLIGRGSGFQSRALEDSGAVSEQSLTERARLREERLNRFWEVWSSEYLRQLPTSVHKMRPYGSLKVGSVVLIHDDKVPRMLWPMGVVVKLHGSSDGVVRSADLRTARGVRTRAIQRLHDLELGCTGSQ